MPDRILRAALFRSERFLTLPDARSRLAFVACVADADDLGNFEAMPGQLRRLWSCADVTDLETVERIAKELETADLVRWYTDLSTGKRYGHIPRSRQRLRSLKRAHPRPPDKIECNEIKQQIGKMSDESPSTVSQSTNNRPSLAGSRAPAESNRSEENRIDKTLAHTPARDPPANASAPQRSAPPPGFFEKVKTLLPQPEPDLAPPDPPPAAEHPKPPRVNGKPVARTIGDIVRSHWQTSQSGIAAMAAMLELRPMPGETFEMLGKRCAIELAKRAPPKQPKAPDVSKTSATAGGAKA